MKFLTSVVVVSAAFILSARSSQIFATPASLTPTEVRIAYFDASGQGFARDVTLVMGRKESLLDPEHNSSKRSIRLETVSQGEVPDGSDVYYIVSFEDSTESVVSENFNIAIKRGAPCSYHVGNVTIETKFPDSVPTRRCDAGT